MSVEAQTINESVRSVAKHSAVYSIAELLKKGIGFFMIPLYTHYLTPSDYGLIEILTIILEVLGMLVGVRILAAQTRYYHIYDEYKQKREVYTTALLFAIFMSVLATAALWGGTSVLSRLTLGSETYAHHYQLMIICFAIQNIYLAGENDLIIRKQSFFYSCLSIALLVLGLTLNITLLAVYRLGAWAILWSMFFTKLANLVVVPVTLRGDNIRFSVDKLWRMIRFGLPLVPESLATFAVHYSDRFFLQRFCSLSDVGVYSLGHKFGMMISILIMAPFQRAWTTYSYEIATKPGATAVYSRIFTYVAFLLILVALAITVFIDDIIHLLAPVSYAGASSIVPWIVLAYVFMGLAGFVSIGIMLSFQTKYMAYIQVPLAVLNMVLNYWLIKSLGIMGAPLATLVTFASMFMITIFVSQRLYPIGYEYHRLAIMGVVAGSLYALSMLVTGPLLWRLLLHGAIVLAFPIGLYFLKFFNDDELKTAQNSINRLLPWLPKLSR